VIQADVLSGDTTPAETVIDACNGCDILVHKVYSQAGFLKREPAWQKYHAEFHTSSRELAAKARTAGSLPPAPADLQRGGVAE